VVAGADTALLEETAETIIADVACALLLISIEAQFAREM